jgi:hypothetical protein
MPQQHFDSFLDELRARTAIEDQLKRFMRGIDRKDWALARSTYHDDAIDEHGFFRGAPDALLAIIARAHERQDHSMHFISNIQIEFLSRQAALVEAYVLLFQRFPAGAEGVPAGSAGVRKIATARYVDRFEARAGAWKVARRTVVFGDVQSEPLAAPFAVPAGFTGQRHGTDDFLYGCRKEAGL